jgi:CubicO group peptidase (beta-lactamase class C family)
LEEKEKLNLHAPITSILPDYPKGNKITVHQLLTHTSGIPNYSNFPEYHQMSLHKHSLNELVDWFKYKSLTNEPGIQYEYSNSNYVLLAHVVEKISKKSYDEMLRINILKPLKLENTGNYTHDQIVKNRARRYSPSPDGLMNAPWYDMSIKLGSGSLYSTVEDLYKFNKALFEEKILTRKSMSSMFTPHIENVGYGWFIDELYGKKVVRINGSSPGIMAHLLRFVEEEITVIFLSNVRTGLGFFLHQDLCAILYERSHKVPEIYKPSKLSKEVMDSFIGNYYFRETKFSIFEREGWLWLRIGHYPNTMYLLPLSDGRLFSRDRYDYLELVKDIEDDNYSLIIKGPGWSQHGILANKKI